MYGFVCDVLSEKGNQVYVTAPTVSVREAVRTMNEKGIGALLVLDSGRVCGIFTERDVLRRVVDEGRAPTLTPVNEVMTPDVECITPGTSVTEAMELMTRRRFRHLPVVDQGEIVGLISIGDLLRRVSTEQEEHIERLTDYITGRAPA